MHCFVSSKKKTRRSHSWFSVACQATLENGPVGRSAGRSVRNAVFGQRNIGRNNDFITFKLLRPYPPTTLPLPNPSLPLPTYYTAPSYLFLPLPTHDTAPFYPIAAPAHRRATTYWSCIRPYGFLSCDKRQVFVTRQGFFSFFCTIKNIRLLLCLFLSSGPNNPISDVLTFFLAIPPAPAKALFRD